MYRVASANAYYEIFWNDADVTISIYDASGKVIRSINLGEKPAGFVTR